MDNLSPSRAKIEQHIVSVFRSLTISDCSSYNQSEISKALAAQGCFDEAWHFARTISTFSVEHRVNALAFVAVADLRHRDETPIAQDLVEQFSSVESEDGGRFLFYITDEDTLGSFPYDTVVSAGTLLFHLNEREQADRAFRMAWDKCWTWHFAPIIAIQRQIGITQTMMDLGMGSWAAEQLIETKKFVESLVSASREQELEAIGMIGIGFHLLGRTNDALTILDEVESKLKSWEEIGTRARILGATVNARIGAELAKYGQVEQGVIWAKKGLNGILRSDVDYFEGLAYRPFVFGYAALALAIAGEVSTSVQFSNRALQELTTVQNMLGGSPDAEQSELACAIALAATYCNQIELAERGLGLGLQNTYESRGNSLKGILSVGNSASGEIVTNQIIKHISQAQQTSQDELWSAIGDLAPVLGDLEVMCEIWKQIEVS